MRNDRIENANEQNMQGETHLSSNLLRDEFLNTALRQDQIKPGDSGTTVPTSPTLPELSLHEPHNPWSSNGDQPPGANGRQSDEQLAWSRAPGGRVYIINKDGTIGFLT